MKLSEAVSISDAMDNPSFAGDFGSREAVSNAAAEGALPPRGIPELEELAGIYFQRQRACDEFADPQIVPARCARLLSWIERALGVPGRLCARSSSSTGTTSPGGRPSSCTDRPTTSSGSRSRRRASSLTSCTRPCVVEEQQALAHRVQDRAVVLVHPGDLALAEAVRLPAQPAADQPGPSERRRRAHGEGRQQDQADVATELLVDARRR